MAQGLTDKVAVVTGAAKGIGRAIAVRLAQDGAAVVVNYSGSVLRARETVGLIEKGDGRAVAVQADVSKVAEVTPTLSGLSAAIVQYRRTIALRNEIENLCQAQEEVARNGGK